ncbi:hypothetical protein HF329_00725 [Chitinophaga oryzae]|uniref:Uncharacterized protein n=1 Tax=Chitinophaga oryzae TaxID=2725414 RepID=A0AAE7D5S6_9BACT|nr:hypothetical protein [Chitinophaga oryzae]QJB29907.1 hypothetical protein HF329_00725 [Chitinophaga oryzae]
MKNVRLGLAVLAVIAAAGGAYATRSTHTVAVRAQSWFEYRPTLPGGTSTPGNYVEVTDNGGCWDGNQLCRIKVEKNTSTGLPDQSALSAMQSAIDAHSPIADQVVFKP